MHSDHEPQNSVTGDPMKKKKFKSPKAQNQNFDVSLKIASININGISKKLETIKIFFQIFKTWHLMHRGIT